MAGKVYRTFRNGRLDGQVTLKEEGGLTDQEVFSMLHMAWMFYNNGKLESAEVVLQGVLAIDPDNMYVDSCLGAVYARMGKLDDALEHLNRAMAVNPADISACVNRGETLFRLGRVEESAADFRRALEMDPQKKDPAANRARLILAGLSRIGRMVRDQRE